MKVAALHPLKCVYRNFKSLGYKLHRDQSPRFVSFAWIQIVVSHVQYLVKQQLSVLFAFVVKLHYEKMIIKETND